MFPAILGQALATAALSQPSQTSGPRESVPRQRTELLRFVKAFNRAWTLEPDDAVLTGSYHPTLLKADGTRLEARRDLYRTAQVVEWSEADTHVDLFNGGQMAVVRCRFTLSYARQGHIRTHTGRELLVLVRENNRWWIVADAAVDENTAADMAHGDPTSNGHSSRRPQTAAKHSGAPRWIECDYTPTSDVRIA